MGLSDLAVALSAQYRRIIDEQKVSRKLSIPLRYLKGEYYAVADIRSGPDKIPAGSKLASVNGQPVHAFVRSLYTQRRMLRWDWENRRYYDAEFYQAERVPAGASLHFTFIQKNGTQTSHNLRLSDRILTQHEQKVESKRVEWFDERGILYIRMPVMEEGDFYPKAIEAASRGRNVRKVIFDIRGNGGGSDDVWRRALESVIDAPIEWKIAVVMQDTPIVLEKLRATEAQRVMVPFLDNASLRMVDRSDSIRPSKESIRFAGPIYIVQDDSVFSSAGAFAAIAKRSAKIVSIGSRTGRLLGFGVSPMVFELPHSKLLYRVEPVIDFSNSSSAEQAYHDEVELLVPVSIEGEIERASHSTDLFSKSYLIEHDPVFRAAMDDVR